MSRYLILVLLNLPLIITAIVGAFVSYKLNNTSKRRLIIKTIFWVVILLCLVFAQNIYTYLYNEGLTQTEPLSLFDVLQITGIIYIFYVVNRLFVKVDVLEKRVQDLHQELSIILSEKDKS
ncbi:hypothetical protein KC950_04380 [Candidatus Saccharibacteria bacterium]|nr:hypothetical protein [Candidatus Saccharibacteria bacterium]